MAAWVVLVWLFSTFCDVSTATTVTGTTEKWHCPEGWLLKIESCYRWGTSHLSFSQAKAQCQEWGSLLRIIRDAEENNHLLASNNGQNFWLGIQGDNNNHWWYWEDGEKHRLMYTSFTNSHRFYNQHCVVWNSVTSYWTAVACGSQSYPFICQRPSVVDCVSGWFGANCTETCHCRGEACNTTSGICQQGCQLGWTGPTCSLEKLKAEAKFYCFKIKSEKVMMFRVNQRGTKYRSVSAIDKSEREVADCTKMHFNHFEPSGMATMRAVKQKNGKFKPACGENMVSDDTATWRFKFQEFPMTSSAFDILFEVTCDFTKAETLRRLVTSNTEKPSNKTTTLTESRVFVSFDIIDPINDQPVTTVKLGQQISLHMALNNGDDFGVTAIAPYNCSVSSLDGSHTVIVLDEYGCAPDDAQVRFSSSDLTRWHSDLFEAFTFQGHDKVNFQCDFHVCFSEQHHYCQDMCTHSKKRKSRKLRKRHRSKGQRQGKEKNLGTTVSIET